MKKKMTVLILMTLVAAGLFAQQTLSPMKHSDVVNSVAFSPDGRRIVSGAFSVIKVWDAETGRVLRTLSGHSDVVNSVAFSPDGRRIVSGSDDKTVKVWDAETGRALN